MDDKVDLAEKLAPLDAPYQPGIVGYLNDCKLAVVKVKGEFVWHEHDETDDVFLVLAGRLTIQLRERDVELGPGELFVVPRGVEHCPKGASYQVLSCQLARGSRVDFPTHSISAVVAKHRHLALNGRRQRPRTSTTSSVLRPAAARHRTGSDRSAGFRFWAAPTPTSAAGRLSTPEDLAGCVPLHLLTARPRRCARRCGSSTACAGTRSRSLSAGDRGVRTSGREWSSSKVAQLRYEGGMWTLYWADGSGRRRPYDDAAPARDVAPLLAAIDEDRTGIFRG